MENWNVKQVYQHFMTEFQLAHNHKEKKTIIAKHDGQFHSIITHAHRIRRNLTPGEIACLNDYYEKCQEYRV